MLSIKQFELLGELIRVFFFIKSILEIDRFIERDSILFKRCYVHYLKILSSQVDGLEA